MIRLSLRKKMATKRHFIYSAWGAPHSLGVASPVKLGVRQRRMASV